MKITKKLALTAKDMELIRQCACGSQTRIEEKLWNRSKMGPDELAFYESGLLRVTALIAKLPTKDYTTEVFWEDEEEEEEEEQVS